MYTYKQSTVRHIYVHNSMLSAIYMYLHTSQAGGKPKSRSFLQTATANLKSPICTEINNFIAIYTKHLPHVCNFSNKTAEVTKTYHASEHFSCVFSTETGIQSNGM